MKNNEPKRYKSKYSPKYDRDYYVKKNQNYLREYYKKATETPEKREERMASQRGNGLKYSRSPKGLFRDLKQRAKRYGVEVNIIQEEWLLEFNNKCPCCNDKQVDFYEVKDRNEDIELKSIQFICRECHFNKVKEQEEINKIHRLSPDYHREQYLKRTEGKVKRRYKPKKDKKNDKKLDFVP